MPSSSMGSGPRRTDTVVLRVEGRTSTVTIGKRSLSALRQGRRASPRVWILDRAVWRHHREILQALMADPRGRPPSRILLTGGEEIKTPESLAELWRRFAATGLSRDGEIVAVGGGTVLDLAGFAAATWMRGVRWTAVPTTLLAAADASVGGKTAVDLDGLKNPVGAFHTAEQVLIDPVLLGTLPRREWRCGLAEVIKGAVIGSPKLFCELEHAAPQLNRLLAHGRADRPVNDVLALPWRRWLTEAVAFKARIVRRDYREGGRRRALNLGHTLAHALEPLLDRPHGEAVSLGIAAVSRAACDEGVCSPRTRDRIIALLEACGLPVRASAPPISAVSAYVTRDKKKAGGTVGWVLPARIGSVLIDRPLDLERVLSRLDG